MEGARRLPGVRDAFLWSPNHLGRGNLVEILTREGRYEDHPDERLEASRHSVDPGTLERLGIPRLAGRDVGPQDGPDGHRVVIVSESLAEALFPGQDPVGRWVSSGRFGGTSYEVIGVAADARHRTRLFNPFGPQWDVYFPYRQMSHRLGTLVLRLDEGASAEAVVPALRATVAEVDPDIPLFAVQSMDERMREEESRARLSAGLVSLYAGIAVILAALGVYGVLAHGVRQRTREIGIRIALGAGAASTVRRVVGQGMRAVIVGLALGGAGAFGVSRLLTSVLYGVSPWDPGVFVAVAVLMPLVALVACVLPARWAVSVDPTEALRSE